MLAITCSMAWLAGRALIKVSERQLASDANKRIDTIIYTHFDKSQEIRFCIGKSLAYGYDFAVAVSNSVGIKIILGAYGLLNTTGL